VELTMAAPASSPFAAAPFWVDLSGDIAKVSQILGAATDAVLAGRASSLVFDLGAHATDPRFLGPFHRWFRRNETLLRTRTKAHALVVPSIWHALQWWIVMKLDRPLIPVAVVRSRERAAAWLAVRQLKAARPSPRG
jgi:hypothetical protein